MTREIVGTGVHGGVADRESKKEREEGKERKIEGVRDEDKISCESSRAVPRRGRQGCSRQGGEAKWHVGSCGGARQRDANAVRDWGRSVEERGRNGR